MTVIPRLRECMRYIIAGLKAAGVTVETSTSFLLDLSSEPYEVPRSLDGFPVSVGFGAELPGWADRVTFYFYADLLAKRRWTVYERPNSSFQIKRIVSGLLSGIKKQKDAIAERERSARLQREAEDNLARFGQALGLHQKDLYHLKQDNLQVEGIRGRPNVVVISVRTSYANAEQIARQYRVDRKHKNKKKKAK